MGQFLGPETDIMGERYFMASQSSSMARTILSCHISPSYFVKQYETMNISIYSFAV
jgi:hypothetical protein